jgi:hypothetical protein
MSWTLCTKVQGEDLFVAVWALLGASDAQTRSSPALLCL